MLAPFFVKPKKSQVKLLETVRAQPRNIEDKRPTCLEVLGSSLLPVEMTGEYFPRFTDEQELETCPLEWYCTG